MTIYELERTARYRPRLELADADAMLARIVQQTPATRTIARRRPAALAGLAAAVAAAAVIAPALLPTSSPGGPSPAAAAELRRLASSAALSGDMPLLEGEFRHQIITEHQLRPELTTTLESWTASDGQVWRRDVTTHADGTPRATQTFLFTTPEPDTAELPTDPDGLRRYLIAHASGSTSTDEAVFSQLAELLRGPMVPAALRSAATQVLARTGHVRLGPRTRDTYGRTVQEIDFVDEQGRPGEVQTIVFDTADARVTAERITVADLSVGVPYFQATTTPIEITDTIPPEVVRNAVAYGSDSDTKPSLGE